MVTDDYEINRRLAEIAGVDVYDANGTGVTLKQRGWPLGPKWSPLTNWSQLGPLQRAHVHVVERRHGGWAVWAIGPDGLDGEWAIEATIERAIALAIIAAHETDQ